MKFRYYKKSDEGYPQKLQCYPAMPSGIYIMGNAPDPGKKSVAIVGSRACSDYGKKEALRFAGALAAYDVQIISGMAFGIDSWAHQGALDFGGKTFAVLGSGVDVCYPKEHFTLYESIVKHGGGILSEFEPGTPPVGWHFPLRNRIISALANVVLVVEAKRKSGSLITADYALEQGVSVYAVPGRTGDSLSAGCNELIAQGAGIALSPEVILEELGLRDGRKKSYENDRLANLSQEENVVLDLLTSAGKSLGELLEMSGMPIGRLTAILTGLCLKGILEEVVPGYYKRNF